MNEKYIDLHEVPEYVVNAARTIWEYSQLQGWGKKWAFMNLMSRDNGLSFVDTRQFHDMSYNFDEKAEQVAKNRGQIVVYPGALRDPA